MGQWGFSNQVSHHIPYMYDYAASRAKAQEKVREVLRRLYVGSEIGQGYGGDEDNGETSAWYLFSALGFYPLQVGSENYVIGSPLFKKATVHLENGRDLVVKAPDNSARNVYVQGLKLNGAALQPLLRQPPRHRQRRHARVRHGPVALELGDRHGRGAAVGDEGRRAGAAAARHDGRRRRDRDGERRGRRGAVRQRLEHRRLADGDAAVAAVPLHGQPAGQLLHADVGHRRRRRPERVGGEGLQRRRAGTCSTSAATRRSAGAPRRGRSSSRVRAATRYYRIEVTKGGGRLGEVELLNPGKADTSPLVTDVDRVVASAGDTVPVKVTVSNYADGAASGTRGGDRGGLDGRARERGVRAARERRVEDVRVPGRVPRGHGPRHLPGAGDA